jgi:hypothetical protein
MGIRKIVIKIGIENKSNGLLINSMTLNDRDTLTMMRVIHLILLFNGWISFEASKYDL